MTTSVGSVSLDVRLNTAGVARDIQALQANAPGNIPVTVTANTAQAQNGLRAVAASASEAANAVGNLANQDVGGLGAGLDEAATSAQRFDQSIAASVVGFQTLASVAGQTFNAVKSFAQQGVATYKGFEGSLNAFRATANATPEQLKALEKEALSIGAATSKTANQSAAAAVELAKLGFSADDTTKNLRGLVALAESSGTSVETSAKIVGAASSVYGRSAQDIGNIVAATANATAADANDFLQAVSQAGAIAKSNNQDLETLATAFGLIRQAGFEASTAATAVKTVINRLSAPGTKEAEAAMKELGVTIRDQTTGQLRNLVELIPEFRAKINQLKPDKQAQLTRTIFGDEGGPAFIALLSQSQQKIDEVNATIRKASKGDTGAGAAAETQAKLQQGLGAATEQLSGSIETIQLQLGKALAPALTAVALSANELLQVFLKAPEPVKNVALAVGAVTTAAAGLIVGYSALNALGVINTAITIANASAQTASLVATRGIAAAQAIWAVASTQVTGALIANTAASLANSASTAATAIATQAAGAGAYFASGGFAAMAASVAAALAPLAALGAAIALIGVVKKTQELKEMNQKLEDLRNNTNIAGQAGVNSAQSLGDTKRARETAKKEGRGLTAQEQEAEKKALSQADRTLPLLQQQLKEAEAVPEANAGLFGMGKGAAEAQNNARAAAIGQIKAQIEQINRLKSSVEASAEADRKKAAAQAALAPTVESVTENLKRQNEQIDRKQSNEQVKLEENIASGGIPEEKVAGLRANLEKQFLAEKIKKNKEAQEQIKKIGGEGATEQLSKLQDEQNKLRLDAAKLAQSEQKRQKDEEVKAKDEALKAEETNLQRSVANAKIAENQKATALKQALASGQISKEEYESRSAQLRTESLNNELAQEDAKIQKYRQMAAQGLISKDKLAQEEIASSQRVSELKNQIADADLAKEEQRKQQRLKEVDEDISKKGLSIQTETSKATLTAKQAQLGGASDEATQQQIDQIQQQQTQKEIGLLQEKLAKTKQLKAEGVLTAKEAADREAQIQQELNQKTLSLIDQQIQAKRRAAVIAIESRLAEQKLPLEKQAAALGNKAQDLGLDEKKLQAQSGLAQALANLEQQRLQFQLQRAELINDDNAKEQIKAQIYQRQFATLLQNQAAQRASVAISRVQQQVEFQRQQIAAKIAVLEAEAALAKARATGASAREVAALSQALSLRQQAISQLGKVQAVQAQINAIEDRKQTAEQLGAREQMQQQRALELQKAAQQKKQEAIEAGIKAQERAIKLTATQDTIAVRQAELQGLSASEAAKKIEAIQISTAQKEMGLLENKLAATKQLRAAGIISAKEAADREAQIQQDLAQANLSLIEKQLEAKRKAAVEAVETELRARKLPLESRAGDLDISAQRSKSVADLFNAQNSYLQSISTLEQERLNTQLKQAELTGNSAQAESIKDQILRAQFAEMDRQLTVKKQQLELEVQQRKIEQERQQINAQIALLEAQAAVAKAKATGASADEIKALQSVVGLREKQIGLADEIAQRQDAADQFRRSQLDVEGQINQEKQAQGLIDREQQKKQASEKGQSGKSEGGTSSGVSGYGQSVYTSTSQSGTWMQGAKTWWEQAATSKQQGVNNIVPTGGQLGGKPGPTQGNEPPVRDMSVTAQNVTVTGPIQGQGEGQPGQTNFDKAASDAAQAVDKQFQAAKSSAGPSGSQPALGVEEAKRRVAEAREALKAGVNQVNASIAAENDARAQEFAQRKGIDYSTAEGKTQAAIGLATEDAAGGRRQAALARAGVSQNLKAEDIQTPQGPDLGKLQNDLIKAEQELKNAQGQAGKPQGLEQTVTRIYEILAKSFGDVKPPQQSQQPPEPPKPPQQSQQAKQSLEQTATSILKLMQDLVKMMGSHKCGGVGNLTVVSSNPTGEAAKLLSELSKKN